MLGHQELPKSLHGAALGGRAALLALALTVMGSFVIVGGAQAQDCEGGYRMLKDEIPVACEGSVGQSSAVVPTATAEEPVHTGSIGSAEAAGPERHMSGEKCYGGYAYRRTANESYITMPMPCN